MRKIVVLIVILLCEVFSGIAQTASYQDAMRKQVNNFRTAKGAAAFQKTADGFLLIAQSEKKDWLSYYYAGLCQVLVAFEKDKTEIDALCNKADGYARKADSLSKNNSEVLVLKSMIAAARIMVDEKKRAQKYGSQSSRYANEAIKLNPDNPRAYLLKARNLIHTPEKLGGGAQKAKATLEKAVEKDKTFKPETTLHPDWGKEEIEKEMKKLTAK